MEQPPCTCYSGSRNIFQKGMRHGSSQKINSDQATLKIITKTPIEGTVNKGGRVQFCSFMSLYIRGCQENFFREFSSDQPDYHSIWGCYDLKKFWLLKNDIIGRGQIFGGRLLGLRGMGICLIAGKFQKKSFSDTPYCTCC